MAVDYKRYLAENVLSERRTVTYRSLGRALKVHSHLAKQMLYEFHRNENAKKPQSVNATYLIAGVQHPPPKKPATNGTHRKHGDDEVMQSSPFLSSSMPQQDVADEPIRTTSILLVREEDMEEAKATFESISSIHIYSLQPTILQDLNILTDVSREILATHGNEDPLEQGKHWGMIQNRNVKRRTGARPPPAPAAAPAKPAVSKPAAAPAKQPSPKEEPSQPKKESESDADAEAPSKVPEKTAPSKQKSGIFASFAKAKPKQKKEETATPAASGAESAQPSDPEDVVFDDDEEEEREDLFLDTGKRVSNKSRESRKEREEKLKKMMEDDDEDMPDAPDTPAELAEAAAEEPAPEETKPVEKPEAKQELKEEVSVQGGRRRGKRQVMKKKTVKDEEGYLVTVEEPVWESFSEDEPAPPPKKKPAPSGPSKGKGGAKNGQGSIMSFFAKKT
ncbi:hypothetical protein VTN00DRAFT_4011 [Thermoascus crustaceus]|uniref:uncharacterized protein n=1 Tax=Thermoascus crustaceus TaxID=5088 RepID=UPI0037430142